MSMCSLACGCRRGTRPTPAAPLVPRMNGPNEVRLTPLPPPSARCLFNGPATLLNAGDTLLNAGDTLFNGRNG